jgi:hypothetical protein
MQKPKEGQGQGQGEKEDSWGAISTGAIVTCITIIDTIILHIHTNDAYIFDTYTGAMGLWKQTTEVTSRFVDDVMKTGKHIM